MYKKILAEDCGTAPIKIDLHIHTPGSYDYKKTYNTDEKEYIEILKVAQANEIRVIAVTDHNTFKGYKCLKTIYEQHKEFSGILLLCGIEITCFTKHILAYFPPTFSSKEQREFLETIGLPTDDEVPKNSASADIFAPAGLLDKIYEVGGFAILAHADSDHGFLQDVLNKEKHKDSVFTGQTLVKMLKREALFGVQIKNKYSIDKLKESLRNKEYRGVDKLGIFSFSDFHGFNNDNRIGKDYTTIKLSERSFEAVKMALDDPKRHLVTKDESNDYPYIIGVAIANDFLKIDEENKYFIMRLHPGVNCIIGGRGTGKSTILQIVSSTLRFNNKKARENGLKRLGEVLLYITAKNIIYCINILNHNTRDKYTNEIFPNPTVKIYKLDGKIFANVTDSAYYNVAKLCGIGYEQGEISSTRNRENGVKSIIENYAFRENNNAFFKAMKSYEYDKKALEKALKKYEDVKQDKPLWVCLEEDKKLDSFVQSMATRRKHLKKIFECYGDVCDEISKILSGKVIVKSCYFISQKNKNFLFSDFLEKVCIQKYNDYKIKIKDTLNNILTINDKAEGFMFFELLLQGKFDEVIEKYNLTRRDKYTMFTKKELIEILSKMRNSIDGTIALMDYEINIVLYTNVNGWDKSKEETFRSALEVSMGQNAVAILSIILDATGEMGDNRTVLLDQPEDDIDNRFIYSSLVEQFRKNANKRQIIVSTHNANIPVGVDADNIILMECQDNKGYIKANGALDKRSITNAVLEVLEGGKDAFERRKGKYYY